MTKSIMNYANYNLGAKLIPLNSKHHRQKPKPLWEKTLNPKKKIFILPDRIPNLILKLFIFFY